MKNRIKTKPSCLRIFSQELKGFSLPTKLNFPFYYQVHPLCELAAKEVQTYLEQQLEFDHNFGLDVTDQESAIGKMFGVLVVEYEGSLGYIAAYSGKLANSNSVAFFVPPVFDMLQSDGYFLKREKYLNEINHKIIEIETSETFVTLKHIFEELKVSNKNKTEAFKTEIKAKKQARKQQRIEKINHLPEEEFLLLEEELIKQSLFDKRLLKHLIEQCQYEENQTLDKIIKYQDEIDSLKELRKKESNVLQQWLFKNYTFLNARNEEKSLLDIFQTSLHIQPPAGAGECCAPKLFQYAYKNQLKPIALAEFWWGQSPKSEVRKHGQFYPSCWGKCEPILGHMLQGLEVEENPFLKNPAQGKELPVVYDDPYLVVVNKPAEFLSVPGIHISDSVYERI